MTTSHDDWDRYGGKEHSMYEVVVTGAFLWLLTAAAFLAGVLFTKHTDGWIK